MYMAGCLAGPFIATAVASSGSQTTWQFFYTAPLGLGVLNLILVGFAFREWITIKRSVPSADSTPSTSREQNAKTEMRKTVSTPKVWLLSLYFFFVLGAIITAGGTSSLAVESLYHTPTYGNK